MDEFKDVFLKKYPRYGRILDMYEESTGVECTFNSITKPRLYKFVNFVSDKVARSSAKTYCAMFKSVLNLYSDVVNLPKGFEDILSVKKDVSQNTWLDDSEIMRIMSCPTCNEVESIVKNSFLLGCMTGARHSDYTCFSTDNIIDGRLTYISKKTHIKSEIPVAPAVLRILEENNNTGISGKMVSDVSFNNNIRSICKRCGINERLKLYKGGKYVEGEKWEFISSHTARRSFATNLYLRGADLYAISKLMGHASVTQTEGYISCGLRNLPENVLNYFFSFR